MSGDNGLTQTISGLSTDGSGGDSYTFSNKKGMTLEMFSPNVSVSLNASAAAAGEQAFGVFMYKAGGDIQINATPSTVSTSITGNGMLARTW